MNQCLQCGKETKTNKRKFCGVSCSAIYTHKHKPRNYPLKPKKYIIKSCECCGKETINKKYCSIVCGNKVNNKLLNSKRPQKPKFCKYCKIQISKQWCHKNTCDNCNPNIKDWSKITLLDIYSKLPKSQANARIRELARNNYKKHYDSSECSNCGYSHHTEICHIKAIKEFDKSIPVTIVNDISNLIALCPNCHWELDNGILNKSEFRESNSVSLIYENKMVS